MESINSVPIELTVVLGNARMPIHQLLRMGRGAVIELDTGEHDEVRILANNKPIARGAVVVRGDRIGVTITSPLKPLAGEPPVAEAEEGGAETATEAASAPPSGAPDADPAAGTNIGADSAMPAAATPAADG